MVDRRADKLLGSPERRSVAADDFEVRQDGDSLTLTGYASVFEAPYDVYGGPDRGGWTEIVDRRAFDKTLGEKPDVHLLVNHEGMPLARTKSGTLDLTTDSRGLQVEARLDRSDPDVQRLETKMRRRDMDEMSFAFRTIRHDFNEETSERRMLELNLNRGDVSVVNFGANPATTTQLRSLLAQVADLTVADALVEARAVERDVLAEAYRTLGTLLRESTPEERRTMTVAEALAAIEQAA